MRGRENLLWDLVSVDEDSIEALPDDDVLVAYRRGRLDGRER